MKSKIRLFDWENSMYSKYRRKERARKYSPRRIVNATQVFSLSLSFSLRSSRSFDLSTSLPLSVYDAHRGKRGWIVQMNFHDAFTKAAHLAMSSAAYRWARGTLQGKPCARNAASNLPEPRRKSQVSPISEATSFVTKEIDNASFSTIFLMQLKIDRKNKIVRD